ncbi:MAG: AAA family ATPase [Phycisphaerales bacterium]|nr:AAA family ATPase [Phycisphaerales bacterium]MCB9862510.1 AAA family ATPase [Phycisphaerales bacterium]
MMDSSAAAHIVKVTVIREPGVAPMSARKREICWDFGIPPREAPCEIVDAMEIGVGPGRIVLVTGPSGSGKSTILRAIADEVGGGAWVAASRFPSKLSVVDCVAPRSQTAVALEILTACGLGEPRLWVRRFQDLSDGERFRAALARTIGSVIRLKDRPVIFCDEFTSALHRRIAKCVAFNLRKLVTRHGLRLVVATTSDDIAADLQADQRIDLGGVSADVVHHQPQRRPATLRRRVHVERGSVRDYRVFGPMHYRHRDSLGFVDKVFLLKETASDEAVGILVVAHAPIELSLRNRATNGRFIRNVRRLNKELRIVRRLIMHPDVRGCGLGHHFVRESLPLVGVRFVEALAAMGTVNPVFEKAGMHCVGQCPQPKGRLRLLERLSKWGVDPFSAEFAQSIEQRPRVRRFVEATIQDWVTSLHTPLKYSPETRTSKQLSGAFRQLLGRPPMYYLWDRDGEYPRIAEASKQPERDRGAADRAERERDALRSTSGKDKLRPTRNRRRGSDSRSNARRRR